MKTWMLLVPLLGLAGCETLCPCCCCSGGKCLKTEQPTALSPETTSAKPGTVIVSPENTKIEFTGSTSLMSQHGHFAAFEGTMLTPTNDPKDMKVQVAVDMDSTTTSIGLLTKHLKGTDFFDVAQYPRAQFDLTSVTPSREPGMYTVAGTMTLHGTTKPVEFPARIALTPQEVTFEGVLPIRQTEFGMTEAARKTNDLVPVNVSIHARRS